MAGIDLPRWLTHPEPRPVEQDDPPPVSVPPIKPEKIAVFLDDIVAICRVHGLWLGHQDAYGAFTVTDQSTETWLREAAAE